MRWALTVALLSIGAWAALALITRPEIVGDEYYHVPVIRGLAAGDWSVIRRLPLPPTYHLLLSGVARVFGDPLVALRTCNVALGVAALALYAAALRARRPAGTSTQLLCFAWHPLLVPFWVFVYTDLATLVVVLVALNFYLRQRHVAAGGALVAACLVRQSSVAFPALFAALAIVDQWNTRRSAPQPPGPAEHNRWIRETLRPTWPYGIAIAIGCGLLLIGRTFVYATPIENRIGFNIAQIYTLLLTAALLWAPRWISLLPRVWRTLIEPSLARPHWVAGAVAAAGLLALLYDNPHHWNRMLDSLRNWPLVYMAKLAWLRYLLTGVILLFTTVFVAWIHRSATPVRLSLLAGFAAMFALPHFLADPRYYVVPFVLFDFFALGARRPTQALAGWYLLVSIGVGAFIVLQPGGYSGIW